MGFPQAIHSPASCTLRALPAPQRLFFRDDIQRKSAGKPQGLTCQGFWEGEKNRCDWERGFKPQGSFSGLGRGLWPRRIDRGASGCGKITDCKPRPHDHCFSSEQMYLLGGKSLRQGLV